MWGGERRKGKEPDPEELFQEAYKDYYESVCRFFVGKGFQREDAIDLTQQTFLRVYQYIGGFRFEASLGTWIREIAISVWRNKIRDLRAKKRDVKEVSFGGLAESQQVVEVPEDRRPDGWGDASLGALGEILADEEKQQLYEAMQRLPPKTRRCLEMRVHDDLKYREIADLLNVSTGTVRAILWQARERLKKELGSYFDKFDLPGDPDGE